MPAPGPDSLTVTISPDLRRTRTLIRFPRDNPADPTEARTTVLVDCGGDPAPLPDEMGTLDHVFVTHPDLFHHNALAATLTDSHAVGYVHYGGALEQYPKSTRDWLTAHRAWPFPTSYSDPVVPFACQGGAALYVLAANASGNPYSANADANAVVLLLVHGSHGLLLLGDAPPVTWRFVERRLAEAKAGGEDPMEAVTDMVLTGHPGEAAAAAPPWVDAFAVQVDPYGSLGVHPGFVAASVSWPGRPSQGPAQDPMRITWTAAGGVGGP